MYASMLAAKTFTSKNPLVARCQIWDKNCSFQIPFETSFDAESERNGLVKVEKMTPEANVKVSGADLT